MLKNYYNLSFLKNNFQKKSDKGNVNNVDIFHIFYTFIEHTFFYGIPKIYTNDKIEKILKKRKNNGIKGKGVNKHDWENHNNQEKWK